MQKNRAFTLIETLVALSIFTTSILTLLAILSQGINNTNYAKSKTTAAYLAQEGIEYIRNMRDTYVLFSADTVIGWADFRNKIGLPNTKCADPNGNGCSFGDFDSSYDITEIAVNGCTSFDCANLPLYYDFSTGKYNSSYFGVNSGFTRKIVATQASPGEIKISSTVYWKQGSSTSSVVFSETLFNWVE